MQIYLTKNLINGKMYIGKDSKSDPNYLGSGLILKNAIKKYGSTNFVKYILEDDIQDLNTLNEREIFYIKKYNAVESDLFYNIMQGGNGGDFYTNHPEREKLREKFIGFLKKIDYSYMKTESYKKKLSDRFSVPVYQFTKTGNLVKEFPSLESACNEFGGSKGNLSSAASGERNYWKNFRWSYFEIPNEIKKKPKGRKKGTKNSYKIKRNHFNIKNVKINCYEDGIFLKTFENRKDAAKYFNTSAGSINQYVISGKTYLKKYTFEKGEEIKKTIYKI